MNVLWDGRLGTRPFGMRSSNPGVLHLPPPVFLKDPGILERARPNWHELSKLVPGISPSGWIDPAMANEIESEFKKRKDYVLVDSADKADIIFLVEGLYSCYWSPAKGTRINYSLWDNGAGWGKNMCLAAVAIAVPSEVYLQDPADPEALLAGRLWEGISL